MSVPTARPLASSFHTIRNRFFGAAHTTYARPSYWHLCIPTYWNFNAHQEAVNTVNGWRRYGPS